MPGRDLSNHKASLCALIALLFFNLSSDLFMAAPITSLHIAFYPLQQTAKR